jgi:lipid-binding SYLF domain-containing protein
VSTYAALFVRVGWDPSEAAQSIEYRSKNLSRSLADSPLVECLISMRTRFIAIPLALLLTLPVAASTGLTKEDKTTLHDAVLDALTLAPDKGIPQEFLPKVDCVLIFPSLTQSAFLVRGKSGYGVVSCRQPDGKTGSAPIYTVGGASIGFQIGGQ